MILLSPRLAAARASIIFLDKVSHHINVKRKPGDHAVFAMAIVFELLEGNEVTGLEAAY